jgi:hypothetical protein
MAGQESLELFQAALSASHLWSACAVGAACLGVFGAPYRLYWRRDSKILASLSIEGRALLGLAFFRSHQAACLVSLALLVGLVPFAVFTEMEAALRHAALVAVVFSSVAWLGPTAALLAGTIVASDKVQAMIASAGGEFQAPKTAWLGVCPGFAAAYISLLLFSLLPWLTHRPPAIGTVEVVFAAAIALPALAAVWAWLAAPSAVAAAVREVAALDQELLAHVELTTASPLERAASALLPAPARLTAMKDAALLRRRYPSPYFVVPLGIIASWLVAGFRPEGYWSWAGIFLGGMGLYTAVMARRSFSEPTEKRALMRTLSISPAHLSAGKRSLFWLRFLLVFGAAGVPLALRSPELGSGLVTVAVLAGITATMGLAATRAK